MRMQLSELFLMSGYLMPKTVEDNKTGAGGALVDGTDVAILEIFGTMLLVLG